MKRRRTMLLCVTATSMAAAVGCTPAEGPVGKVGRTDYIEPDASGENAVEASAPATVRSAQVTGDPTPNLDAGVPPFHPDRVGTTAVVNDDVSPTVGTTARVPDKKK